MKNFVIATTAGAIVGATVSMILPLEKSKSKFKSRILKKGKRAKSKIVKEIAGFMYRVI